MSHSAPLIVSQELEDLFKKAADGSSPLRYIHIQIKEENFIVQNSSKGSEDISADYNSQSEHVSETEASYFLFRKGDNHSEWVLINFVPEKVPVKDKMVFASAKGNLKSKLGFSHFVDEVHLTSKPELSYDVFKGNAAPQESRSHEEIIRDDMHKQEDKEREERKELHKEKEKTPSKSGSVLGGYHSLSIPLDSSAKDKIQEFKSGSVNLVELKISENKEHVEVTFGKTVSGASLKNEINKSEPRFYIYHFDSTSVFFYCCPENSPRSLRMLYSTSKLGTANQISELGVDLAEKKVEVSDPTELSDSFLKQETTKTKMTGLTGGMKGGGSLPEGGGVVKAKSVNTVENHPVYSLMAGQNTGAKKKVVMPPRGAYGGF